MIHITARYPFFSSLRSGTDSIVISCSWLQVLGRTPLECVIPSPPQPHWSPHESEIKLNFWTPPDPSFGFRPDALYHKAYLLDNVHLSEFWPTPLLYHRLLIGGLALTESGYINWRTFCRSSGISNRQFWSRETFHLWTYRPRNMLARQ